jgi:AraC family transcriptional regulator, regulatory protein of adaptative response / methylated-DNA-[protein]-cysteine methyltransferase
MQFSPSHHDLFVTHEVMPPKKYHTKDQELETRFGWHDTLFGKALIAIIDNKLCGLEFADEGQEQTIFDDMTRRWPKASFIEDAPAIKPFANRIFNIDEWKSNKPLRVLLIGTGFQVRVWQELLKIPLAKTCSYFDIATQIGEPKATRAVGSALGKNSIAFIIPCHRVLKKSGAIGKYRWGKDRKSSILDWEAEQIEA